MNKFTTTHRVSSETNGHFRDMCEKAGTPATKRQAAKFRSKRGLAFGQHKGELKTKHLN